MTHVPVFLITGPPCRYARFASLALSTGGDYTCINNAARCSTALRAPLRGRGWDRIVARILGLRLCAFFINK